MRSLHSLTLTLGALAVGIAALTGCTQTGNSAAADQIIQVPAEVATLTEAEKLASPGDTILIAPGVYEEQLLITTPDITIRGEDRNTTIIDASDVRPYGIVAVADGVRVENLTVTRATFYGLLFTGLHDETGPSAPSVTGYEPWDPSEFPPLQRFEADHITATNNGLYGIYAFNAQHGVIRDSYASGSADSGLYVGQCEECDILVTGNIAERNAVGFENSNASDSVVITGNRFTHNRVGITLLSNYQEAFHPQHSNTIVGNLIADNNETDTPVQAMGGFGTGIGISGGTGNRIDHNLITGHTRAAVIFDNAEDLPASGNAFRENTLTGNTLTFANISAPRAAATDNCALPTAEPTLPGDLAAALTTAQCSPSITTSGGSAAPHHSDDAPWVEAPRGISFRDVALPPNQPNLPQRDSYPRLPDRITMPDLASPTTPTPELLTQSSGTR